MGATSWNIRELKEAKKRMRAEAERILQDALVAVCERLVGDALREKEYRNLTGNTVTSYTCGVFVRGRLVHVAQSGEGMSAPIRGKLRKGESHYFDPDYDGRRRRGTGSTDTDGGHGGDTAMDFIFSHKAGKRGFEIVMTTGTEYSTYLETEHDLNVLTDTYENAKGILLSNLKPIGR